MNSMNSFKFINPKDRAIVWNREISDIEKQRINKIEDNFFLKYFLINFINFNIYFHLHVRFFKLFYHIK